MSSVAERAASELTSAAHEGALLLDEKRPGWENEIDVDQLDMGSYKSCVLGQLHHGDYSKGLGQLGIDSFGDDARLGFDNFLLRAPSGSTREALYQALTEDWKKEIADRQAA